MRTQDIRVAVIAYIRDRVARETEGTWGAAAKIARATNTTPTHVGNVKNGKTAAGPDFTAALARYWEMTEEELEAKALKWWKDAGSPPTPRYSAVRSPSGDPNYPNLAESIGILRREGVVDERLLKEAEQTKLNSKTDLPVTVWLKMIELESELRRRAAPPSHEEDDAPAPVRPSRGKKN